MLLRLSVAPVLAWEYVSRELQFVRGCRPPEVLISDEVNRHAIRQWWKKIQVFFDVLGDGGFEEIGKPQQRPETSEFTVGWKLFGSSCPWAPLNVKEKTTRLYYKSPTSLLTA